MTIKELVEEASKRVEQEYGPQLIRVSKNLTVRVMCQKEVPEAMRKKGWTEDMRLYAPEDCSHDQWFRIKLSAEESFCSLCGSTLHVELVKREDQ